MNVVVTGANGFIGKNLSVALSRRDDLELFKLTCESTDEDWAEAIARADFVFHLAGVNRPKGDESYGDNLKLTVKLLDLIKQSNKNTPLVFSSSTQVERDNDYGKSKLEAEKKLELYAKTNPVYIYRLANVFGKWCKPNYNSVIATFCYNIANAQAIQINDHNYEVNFIYVDDVVADFLSLLKKEHSSQLNYMKIDKLYKLSLGELANKLNSYNDLYNKHEVPSFQEQLDKKLYATFLSYMPESRVTANYDLKTDERGSLFEIIKSDDFGQMFFSKTKPGVVRGNHYHDSKIEKFIVLNGCAKISMRCVCTNKTLEFIVSGDKPQVVNILPGYTHSLENVGEDELNTLFWVNEKFDPNRPDTYFEKV